MSIAPILLAALLPLGVGGSGSPPVQPDGVRAPATPGVREAPTPIRGRWVFASVPHVDLWFHGMATVDPAGPGPIPLYDLAYPARMRREKEAAGVGSTVLDHRAGYFRDAFRRDPAMEVLHFLPLYFAAAGRIEVFQALKTLAVTRDGIPNAQTPRTHLGLVAVGSVLTTPGQRALLGEFVSVLEAEWDVFFSDYRRTTVADSDASLSAMQDLWDREFGPALGPLLAGLNLPEGSVLPTRSIGPEGRIFSGLPRDHSDNALVVSAPGAGEDPKTALYSVLRELSFPLAREALGGAAEAGQDRGAAEALAAMAAIRAGALVLERFLPGELTAYQEFFLSRAGRASGSTESPTAVFQEAFPLDEGQILALREVIVTTVTNGGEG